MEPLTAVHRLMHSGVQTAGLLFGDLADCTPIFGDKMKQYLVLLLIVLLTACALATQTSPQPTTPALSAVEVAVPPANFTRTELSTDLFPRGVDNTHYVASEIESGTLYLIDIESGQRLVISENGGSGPVVLMPTTVSWIDGDGQVQQYHRLSGETQQITQTAAERLNLVGNDRWLVWQDKRHEMGDENYYAADIYAYDLVSGKEIPVAVADGVQQQPALFNDLVVWADNRNSPVRGEPLEGCGNCPDNPFDIYSFNLHTGETAVLQADGQHNAQPTISYNRVAWITFGEGIKVLDLTTGVVETAVPYQQGIVQPWLFGNQLRYLIKQDCDVIHIDESGQEIPANTGAFLTDLTTHETKQLTTYKEPLVLHNQANMIIAEGCMTGFDSVYLLQDVSLPSAESPVQGAAVISHDPELQVTEWAYLGPDANVGFPPASENVRVLDALHYEIRLRQTAVGFDLMWGNLPCSTQPVLFIEPDNQLAFWPGNMVGEDCESMEANHMISVSLDKTVPLAEWRFVFHASPDS